MKSVFTGAYTKFLLTLIQARKAIGLTQRELAIKLGRPQSFVSKYERGERRLDVIEFLLVARKLHLSVVDVITTLEHEVAKTPDSDRDER